MSILREPGTGVIREALCVALGHLIGFIAGCEFPEHISTRRLKQSPAAFHKTAISIFG
jgi:hypothetical protein